MKKGKKISRLTNMKVVLWGFAAVFWGLLTIENCIPVLPNPETMTVLVIIEVLLIWRFVVNLKIYRSAEYQQMQQEARSEWAARRTMKQQKSERIPVKPNDIEEVKYLGIGTTRQKRGGLSGALLGGFFGGPIGAVVGAAFPKYEEGLHRFAVKYASGRVKIKDVSEDSWEFRELLKYVAWEEL